MVKIYDIQGDVLIEVGVEDTSSSYRSIDGRHELTLKYSLSSPFEVPIGSWCLFDGNRFELMSHLDVTMRHTRHYEYTLVMKGSFGLLSRFKFRNTVDGRLMFDMVAKPKEFVEMIVSNLNERDGGWIVGEDTLDADERLVSFNHVSCSNALKAVAEAFETEYEVYGKTISIKRVEYNKDNPLNLSYGKGNGFKSGVGRTKYDDGLSVSTMFIQGGSKNISYKDYGAAELHLPKSYSFRFDGERFEGEDGFDSAKAMEFATDSHGYSVSVKDAAFGREDSLDLTEIYPMRKGEVSRVNFLYRGQSFQSPDPSWTEDEWNEVQIDIYDDTIPADLDYSECLLENNQPLVVAFQSGELAGRDFDATFIKQGNRFELKKQEYNGQPMPQDSFVPSVGDSYVVFNVSLPASYISDISTYSGAEFDALREATRSLYEKHEPRFTFSGEIDEIWSRKNWQDIRGHFRIGGYIRFANEEITNDWSSLVRIVGITQNVNNPYHPKLELSNAIYKGSVSSRLSQIENQEAHVEELYQESKRFAKRRFTDAMKTMEMVEKAFGEKFTETVRPVTVQTMMMLVGDERLQFVLTDAIDSNSTADLVYSYDSENGSFSVASAFIKHMTLGIDSISPVHSDSEYRRWVVNGVSQALERESGYYLYAKVSKSGSDGEFELHDDVQNDTDESYYLLVGILNSEDNGLRSFAPMFGYTEVRPGQIVTENVRSADGKTWLDLLRGILHLNDKAGVSGVIESAKGDKSIAAWFGGLMEDLESDSNATDPANTLFRHDGSGYLAKGNIKFNEKGEVELSPNIKISGTGDETLDSILTMIAVFNDMFSFVDDTTIKTKYNLYSEGEISAGGEGEVIGTGGEGGLDYDSLQKYLDENRYATQDWVDDQGYASSASVTALDTKVTSLGTRVTNLSDRVTNLEAGGGTGGGDIDLTAYATKDWVEDKGYATLNAVSTALLKKQDKITNLAAIESGAAKGATAVQPESLAKVATSGSYDDLSNKPTIPAAVTEATVASWGFTKNTGNYTKPTTGIPKSDLVSAVQQSLNKADTALQSIPDEYITEDELATAIANKVDKDGDKVLSDNNYTDEDKAKLDGLSKYDDTALTKRIAAAEGEIQNIKKDVSDNSDAIDDVDSRLQTIEAWHNTIGQKFSIDKDAVKLSGDFFTTGENSAAGKGEVIGGEGGGGIDYDELEQYLDGKNYATESWVEGKNYATRAELNRKQDVISDIDTIRQNALKGANALTEIPSEYITESELNSKGYITQIPSEYVTETELNGKGYAKASEVESALGGKVDKDGNKVLSDNNYTDAEKSKLAGLNNYDDSALTQRVANVEKEASDNGLRLDQIEVRADNHENAISGLLGRLATIESWRTEWDKHISYDSQKKAVKIIGDFYATGESSASGMGEEIGDIQQLITRLAAAEATITQQNQQLAALGTALGALQSELEELRNQIK